MKLSPAEQLILVNQGLLLSGVAALVGLAGTNEAATKLMNLLIAQVDATKAILEEAEPA